MRILCQIADVIVARSKRGSGWKHPTAHKALVSRDSLETCAALVALPSESRQQKRKDYNRRPPNGKQAVPDMRNMGEADVAASARKAAATGDNASIG